MKYKLVAFDVDGTLVDDIVFLWRELHEKIGTLKEDKIYYEKYENKEISYAEWCEIDANLWREKKVKKEVFLEVVNKMKLMPGAIETIEKLKENGIKIALISGSLNIVVENLIPNHNNYFNHILINKIHFDENDFIGKIEPTNFDFENKALGLEYICKLEGIKPEECVFVGDHHNDREIAKRAGLGIAFNCKDEELATIADVLIEKKDLREILPHILGE